MKATIKNLFRNQHGPNKTISLCYGILFLAVASFGPNAEAIFIEGMERPTYQVELDILEASGDFETIESYGLTHFTVDGYNTGGFNVRTNDFRYFAKLFIRYSEDLGCGSLRHFAIEESGFNDLGKAKDYLRIVVIDHTQRKCDDEKTGVQAMFYSGPEFLDDNLGEEAESALLGVGDAEHVYTIM